MLLVILTLHQWSIYVERFVKLHVILLQLREIPPTADTVRWTTGQRPVISENEKLPKDMNMNGSRAKVQRR